MCVLQRGYTWPSREGGGFLPLHRTNLFAGGEVYQNTHKQRSVPPLPPLQPSVLDFKPAEMDLKLTDA